MLVRAYVVPFEAEHMVMNAYHRRIVACPNEEEADEYIKNMEGTEDNENIDSERESL